MAPTEPNKLLWNNHGNILYNGYTVHSLLCAENIYPLYRDMGFTTGNLVFSRYRSLSVIQSTSLKATEIPCLLQGTGLLQRHYIGRTLLL
ncbi:hypothetical protein XENTR_v10017311 [Xenopus tropicalis]|nr:hypothetical protein XENTR_v10017311 [Xenopus tropicalis]